MAQNTAPSGAGAGQGGEAGDVQGQAPTPVKPVKTAEVQSQGDVAGVPGDITPVTGGQDPELGFIQDAPDILGTGEEGTKPGRSGFEDYDAALTAGAGKGTPLAEGEPAATGAEAEPAPAAEEKFVFAGKEYDSKERAEHAHKTLQGQFKAWGRKDAEADKRIADLERAVIGWQQLWQALPEDARARVTGDVGPSGQQTRGGRPAAEPAAGLAESVIKGTDWNTVKHIIDSDGIEAGIRFALFDALDRVESVFDERLKKSSAGFEAFQQRQHAEQVAVQLFTDARSWTTDAGVPLYPELSDGNQARHVLDVWDRLQLPPESKNSPAGVYFAVLAYRDLIARVMGSAKAKGGNGATTPTPAAAPKVPNALSAGIEGAVQAATAGVAPGTQRTVPQRRISSKDAVAQSILEAGIGSDPELGLLP